MGKGGKLPETSTHKDRDRPIGWEEIKLHSSRTDKWIVIDNNVYEITNWSRKHPGGSRVLSHYAAQDATEAFRAFHKDKAMVRKYMAPLKIGRLSEDPGAGKESRRKKEEEMKKDFEELRLTAEKMGLFKPSYTFFILVLIHILVFEVLAYLTLYYCGTGWIPFIISLLCYTITQAQIGWNHHDYGHLSVFSSSKLNHFLHQLTLGFMKGAGTDWWNHVHYQHHAKPNVIDKDPDVRMENLFVLGETMAKRIAEKKSSSMPFNWQHRYFFILGPPLLYPVYFQFMIFRHAYTRRRWLDFLCMMTYYVKFAVLYIPLLGVGWTVVYFFTFKCLESHWFTWVTQCNHLPMEIDDDKEKPWLTLQMSATCDLEKSLFNDWFTGHLNFQIEHHLFPTMPRHNLYKVQPLVKSLCEKHDIAHEVKPIWTALCDVISSLKHSGELWHFYHHAYNIPAEKGQT